ALLPEPEERPIRALATQHAHCEPRRYDNKAQKPDREGHRPKRKGKRHSQNNILNNPHRHLAASATACVLEHSSPERSPPDYRLGPAPALAVSPHFVPKT